MSKGRQPPPPPRDHATAIRDRLGRAAYEAATDSEGDTTWDTANATAKELYRRVGDAVLSAIKTPGQRRGDLTVASLYTPDGRPVVELTADTSPAQFSPAKAREIALLLLEAADAAESDALIAAFGREVLDLDMVEAARLIDRFRRLRETRRGKGATSA